jgi:tetratricopeptide (TPR) repeat protein
MRAWLLTTCCSLLCLAGCRTIQPEGSTVPVGDGDPLSSKDQAFAKALAHYGQGLLCQSEEGNTSERALRQLQAAAEADPENHDLHSRIAVIALRRKMPEAAVAALETSYRYDPRTYERCVDLAAIYQAVGRREDAIVQYKKALKLDRTPEAVYVALAGLYFQGSKDRLALQMLERGRKHAETNALIPIFTFEQAKRFVTHKAIARAIPCFEKLAEWDASRRPQLYQLLGELYLTQGDQASAIDVLTRATQLPTPLPEAFTSLAAIHLQRNERALGLSVLEDAVAQAPDNLMLLFTLGCVYSDGDAYAKAIPLFEQASHLSVAKNAIAKEPALLTEAFYLYYGAAYERTGRIDDAKHVFETCIRNYPKSDRALNYLAYMLAEADRDLDQARGYVERAIAMAPDNAAYLDTLGWIYFQQGRHKEALKEIKQAEALMGTPDPELLHHLGDIHSALKDEQQAIACWSASYALDPKNETVAEQLRKRGLDLDAILRDTMMEEATPTNAPHAP